MPLISKSNLMSSQLEQLVNMHAMTYGAILESTRPCSNVSRNERRCAVVKVIDRDKLIWRGNFAPKSL